MLQDDFELEKENLDSQNISDALMHFLALCDYKYSFNCAVCGFHPPTLIMDLNKKINFSCTKVIDRDEEFDEEVDSKVDCKKFWHQVELNMICKGICKDVATKHETVPSYKNWAPYIGDATRVGNLIYDSEFANMKQSSSSFEEYVKDLTEEYLRTMFVNGTYKEVKKMAKSFNVANHYKSK